MANHFSAIKRARQTTKRTARNRANTSTMRTSLRVLREALEKGDKAAAEQTYRETVSALDKAIQKGVLHQNTTCGGRLLYLGVPRTSKLPLSVGTILRPQRGNPKELSNFRVRRSIYLGKSGNSCFIQPEL